MKGLEVKKILKKNGFSLKVVAEKMNETPQNFQALLNVEDIKTGVLERISNSINKNILFFYGNDDANQIEIVNEIIYNIKQIRYLYQRIVDVNIIISDYLKIRGDIDYTGEAAEIMNNLIITEHGFVKWKEFDSNEMKIYNSKLKEAVRLLNEMFFIRFKLLFNNIKSQKI